MTDVAVKPADWEALVGAVLKGETDNLNVLLDRVDEENELTRYYLYVRWMDGAAPRPGPDAPIQDWPPWGSDWFSSYERFTKQFVEDYVGRQTSNAIYIIVTEDPAGEVGWFTLDEFFG